MHIGRPGPVAAGADAGEDTGVIGHHAQCASGRAPCSECRGPQARATAQGAVPPEADDDTTQ